MARKHTYIEWQETSATAVLPDGSIRQDWWNFIEDGDPVRLKFVFRETGYCLLIAGKIQCLANLIEKGNKDPDGLSLLFNERDLITLDDQYTGGLLGKELHKRSLKGANQRPRAFSWEIAVRFRLSPAERHESNLDRILKTSPGKAEQNLMEISNRPADEQFNQAEKDTIFATLTSRFTNDSAEKILRFGHQLFSKEQIEAITLNPEFREKMFRRRWLTGGEFPTFNFRDGCRDKQQFLAHQGKIRWKSSQSVYTNNHDITWADLSWICDPDIPVQTLVSLLLPDKNNQFLNHLSMPAYKGEFPDLPRLAALANRHYALEIEKDAETTQKLTKNVATRTADHLQQHLGKENMLRLYPTDGLNHDLQDAIGLLIAAQI